MSIYELFWNARLEAYVVAADDAEAERLVYEHHLKDVTRGGVASWSWRLVWPEPPSGAAS